MQASFPQRETLSHICSLQLYPNFLGLVIATEHNGFGRRIEIRLRYVVTLCYVNATLQHLFKESPINMLKQDLHFSCFTYTIIQTFAISL